MTCVLGARAHAQTEPKLVVLVAVDQLREDYLERFQPQFTSGFKRLLEQGAFFTNAFQDHGATVTAVGHSTMLSGRYPRHTGIIGNSLGVPDPQARTLNGRGEGASPFRFRGSTLIDWLRVRDARSRALSVSVKDRSAILPLGRAMQSVFWYSSDGTFTTSNYYADTLPTWLRTFNAQKLPEKYVGMEWKPLLPVRMYPEPDTVPQEKGGQDATFPHRLPTELSKAIAQLANFPWMDEILLELAITGADSMQLGRSGHLDLLSVSLSTTDLIGHAYGPDSREVHDQMLRLDRALGAFLDRLDQRFQPGEYLLVLTADHGVSSFPSLHRANDSDDDAEYHIDVQNVLRSLRPMLDARGIKGNAVSVQTGMLLFDAAQLNHDQALMDSLTERFVASMRGLKGVERIDYVKDLAKADTLHDAVARRWNNMVPRDLAIPVVVTIGERYVWGTGASATHGTPHDADAHVPIIFLGTPFRAGKYKQFARTVDIAPTLAQVLRVQPTEPLDGKPLSQAIK